MRVRLALTLLLVAGGLVFVVPGRAFACSCSPSPPFGKALKEADAVFAGWVSSSEQTSGQNFPGSVPYGNFAYTFEVDEVVGGEVGPTVEVSSHSSGAACGIRFRKGPRYIVFAYENGRGLETYSCSRTETINETVSFGGEAPTGEARTGGPIDIDMESGPRLVLLGAAALIGVGALLVLLRRRAR